MSWRDRSAVAAVGALYCLTGLAVAGAFALSLTSWLAAGLIVRLAFAAMLAVIVTAAVIARCSHGAKPRRWAVHVFRYSGWGPLLLGGNAGLALLGIWWSFVTLVMTPNHRGGSFDPEDGVACPPDRHLALRELAAEAAVAAGSPAPRTLYLTLDSTVMTRRHVAAAGLYALAVLDPQQLRAAFTRSFALHGRGSLAWRIHRHCSRGLGRSDDSGKLDLASYVFFPRLALGLLLTRAAAEAHEARADKLAVGAWTAAALDAARSQLLALGEIEGQYHRQAVAPVLLLGHRPHLVEGLRHWLGGTKAAPCPAPETSALALVDSPWLVEGQLVKNLGLHLKSLPWEGIARELYLHNWETVLAEHADRVRGWSPRNFPELCRDLDAVGRRLLDDKAFDYSPAHRARMAETVLGIALAMCLRRAGWNVYDLPGQPLWLEAHAERFEPFALISGLRTGETSPESFVESCGRAGILDCDLSGADA
ncbi:MAG TPA: hypothetical protein VN709_00825 [Terriglobales bacterium]|nr:hypothetical protein [Terriglobales bacterium]